MAFSNFDETFIAGKSVPGKPLDTSFSVFQVDFFFDFSQIFGNHRTHYSAMYDRSSCKVCGERGRGTYMVLLSMKIL